MVQNFDQNGKFLKGPKNFSGPKTNDSSFECRALCCTWFNSGFAAFSFSKTLQRYSTLKSQRNDDGFLEIDYFSVKSGDIMRTESLRPVTVWNCSSNDEVSVLSFYPV